MLYEAMVNRIIFLVFILGKLIIGMQKLHERFFSSGKIKIVMWKWKQNIKPKYAKNEIE